MIKNIKLSNWRQFKNIDIDFDNTLTVLTGANGSGKTTILDIISYLFGFKYSYTGVPKRDSYGDLIYSNSVENLIPINLDMPNTSIILGELSYSFNNQNEIINNTANIVVPNKVSSTYNISINNVSGPCPGYFITSHRNTFKYKQVSTIPTKALTRNDIFQNYRNFISNKEFRGFLSDRDSPTLLIKESLISLAALGFGNNIVVKNDESIKLFNGFQNILQKVLPPKLGFKQIRIEVPEVILETSSGDFAIDAVSGGIASIIELAWQIYMAYSPNENYTIIIDEPENHLHPEMQRSLLPNLIEAFPNVQFIVSTHNPFIITSVPSSKVYVLDYNDNGKVESYKLDDINKSGTSNEILRDVLGLESTMPIWAENTLKDIINKYSSNPLTESSLMHLRNDLKKLKLDKYVPIAIANLVEEKKND